MIEPQDKPFTQIRWERRDISFSQFVTDVDKKLYDLSPKHQRQVVHTDKWQAAIITNFLRFNNLSAVTFHTRDKPDGSQIFESLDGKQRCTAVYRFMKDQLAVDFSGTCFDDATYNNKTTFKKLTLPHQHIMENRILLEAKIAQCKFSDQMIAEFFQGAQEHRKTSLGEHLNSCMMSPLRVPLLAVQDEIVVLLDILIPSNNRHAHLEMLTRLAYVRWAKDHSAVKFDPSPSIIKKWFIKEDGKIKDSFKKSVKLMLELLDQGHIEQKQSKGTFLPLYKWMLENVWNKDVIVVAKLEFLKNKLKDGKITFKNVAGCHDASASRYNQLLECMAEDEKA